MEDKENLHSYFVKLITCLDEIKYNCKDRNRISKEEVVKDAIDKDLWNCLTQKISWT